MYSGFSATGPDQGANDVLMELEAQIETLVIKNETLAKEKATLLEAYEDLEEDIGRLIDEALAKQNSTTTELQLQATMQEKELAEEERVRKDLENGMHDIQACSPRKLFLLFRVRIYVNVSSPHTTKPFLDTFTTMIGT